MFDGFVRAPFSPDRNLARSYVHIIFDAVSDGTRPACVCPPLGGVDPGSRRMHRYGWGNGIQLGRLHTSVLRDEPRKCKIVFQPRGTEDQGEQGQEEDDDGEEQQREEEDEQEEEEQEEDGLGEEGGPAATEYYRTRT